LDKASSKLNGLESIDAEDAINPLAPYTGHLHSTRPTVLGRLLRFAATKLLIFPVMGIGDRSSQTSACHHPALRREPNLSVHCCL
jgi:hypothetical protein